MFAVGRNDDLEVKVMIISVRCIGRTGHTLPMSVTLTALSRLPLSWSRTATVLTPSSLISFIASRTVEFTVEATTASYRLSEGRANEQRELVRNFWRDGVFAAYEENHERSPRSDTMPR